MRVEWVAYTLKNYLTDFNEKFNLFLLDISEIRIVYKVVWTIHLKIYTKCNI